MPWITTIPPSQATDPLAAAYQRQAAMLGRPSEFTMLGSLDPDLVAARLDLYRASEHCPSALTRRQRLIIAYVTSVLNHAPHCASQVRLKLAQTGVSQASIDAMDYGHYEDLEPAEVAVARYAHWLTVDPGQMSQADVQALRAVGLDDLAIVDANNTCAHLNYVNASQAASGCITRSAPTSPPSPPFPTSAERSTPCEL